jgi:hypothetical protein
MKHCTLCGEAFTNIKTYANHIRWNHKKIDYRRQQCDFCKKSLRAENYNKHITVCIKNPSNIKLCKNCNKPVRSVYEKFCSLSCSATYNNTHKLHGTRRSKLEVWLENKLITNFPNLEFHFNKKDTIGSELDIFIPQLRLAFELNGIYHYKSIHGPALLQRIQNNDLNKHNICIERGIKLYSVDTSSLSTFNGKAAEPFYNNIKNTINNYR